MRASIRDAQVLAALRPLEVTAYLRASGWCQSSATADKWIVWTKNSDFEIVLPLNRQFGDFTQRMADVLKTLEAVEERSQLEILNDLLTTSADILRLRITDAETSDGSIPIEEGAHMAQKARDLMMAAACAALDRRAWFQSRQPGQAVEYLKKVRMGQTERGSYGLTIISRVPPILAVPPGEQLFEVEQPYERQVTTTLAHAVTAVKEAAGQAVVTGNFQGFQAAVSRGVSANLCDAVAGLSGSAENERCVEISFSWSRTRPAETDTPCRVMLPSDAMPVIREAGRIFRETSPRDEFEVRGPVVKLERPDSETVGKVTVLAFIDEQPRKVAFTVGDPDYHTAVQAHDSQETISCYGSLSREGRAFVLKNPRGLQIEPDE